jgi:type I restriction enzyme S subunit
MTSNYKRLGDYVQLVDERNRDLAITTLLGLTVNKKFIPSVANTVGTNMKNYKIIRKNQFACSLMQVRRDKKIPVALLQDLDEAIISQAYPVFEIVDTNELNPEYLMMWFSREEFDRHALFLAVGGVRGSLEWEDLMNTQLPVPSIEKQNEIVTEYNTVVNRIKLNEQINQKLEETAQGLYKHWFVDFEFPDENGKPYKSSGGKMVYNAELDKEIPEGWEVKPFTKVIKLSGGGTPSTNVKEYWNGKIPFFTPKDIAKSYYTYTTEKYLTEEGLSNCSSRLYPINTTFVTARGTVGAIGLSGKPMAMNQSCYAVLSNNLVGKYYTHQLTIDTVKRLKEEAIGAVFKALVTKDFDSKIVLSPNENILNEFELKVNSVYELIQNKSKEVNKLTELKRLLLSKMTKV